MPVCFLTRDTKNVDPDGRWSEEEFERVWKGEAIIRIYYMKILKNLYQMKPKERNSKKKKKGVKCEACKLGLYFITLQQTLI